MDFYDVLDKVQDLLMQGGRVYRPEMVSDE